MAIAYKTSSANSRLTDFEDIRDYVVNNSVRSMPRTIKKQDPDSDSLLQQY
mgnify:CR=1 FL=1